MKIIVVDDHPLILEALRHVLQQLHAEVAVFTARSGEHARQLIPQHPDVDLLLLDVSLPDVNGLELLAELRDKYPGIPAVILSGSTDGREAVVQALNLGAMGYIPKSLPSEVILGALRLVLSGGIYLPPEVIEANAHTRISDAAAGATKRPRTALDLGLTERQAQVLSLMVRGLPNKQICRELQLAEGTVKVHVASILRTLNVTNRTQAVIEVSRLGLRFDGGWSLGSKL